MYVKVSGCNHMSCTCGSHNCFKCGACFRLAGECYEHLSEKHGGCFDVPPEWALKNLLLFCISYVMQF